MNSLYEAVFRELQLPSVLTDCAMGRISIPFSGVTNPAEWFGFPPALLPVWSDASLPYYLGYWKHWFTSRPASFVEMYVGAGRRVREVARTPDQLFYHAIMTAVCAQDEVTPEIERFAYSLGIANLSEIDDVSLKTGDDPHGYGAMSPFTSVIPLEVVSRESQYTGSFPTGIFSEMNCWWNDACLFEVSDELLNNWPRNIVKPPWLESEDVVESFETFMKNDDFHGAWLILNSPGWSIIAAKSAITQLALAAGDYRFSLLANAWTSVADASAGSY